MSEQSAAKPRSILTWALWGAALIGVAAVVYITAQSSTKPSGATAPGKKPAAVQHSVAAKLEHPSDGALPPDYTFYDGTGKAMKIADFKGKVLVVNLWATWCGPCKIEMPQLAKLAAEYEGKPVAVVAVAIDGDRDADKAEAFIAKNAPLVFYRDPKLKLPYDLKPPTSAMPTTVIFGKDGVERGRVLGPAEWSGKDAKAVIDKVLAEG